MENFLQNFFSHGILFTLLVIAAAVVFVFMLQRFLYFFVWLLLFLVVAGGALMIYDPTVGPVIKEVVWPTAKADNTVAPLMERLDNLKKKLESLYYSEPALPPEAPVITTPPTTTTSTPTSTTPATTTTSQPEQK